MRAGLVFSVVCESKHCVGTVRTTQEYRFSETKQRILEVLYIQIILMAKPALLFLF